MKIYGGEVRTPMPNTRPPSLDKRSVDIAQDTTGLQEIARAFKTAGDVQDRAEHEQARAWASTAISGARLQWTQEYVKRQSTAEAGAPDFTPKILEDFDKFHGEALESAPNDASRRFYDERLADLRADLGSKAAVYEAQARIDWRADQFRQSGDNLAKLMNSDPGQFSKALAEQLAIIDSSDMPQIAKSKTREDMINRVSGAAVWSQIQRSPTGFLQSIGFYGEGNTPAGGKVRKASGDLTGITGNSAFDMLPFEKRVTAFQQAIAEKARIDTDADRLSEKERKRIGDDASKNLWEKHFKGELKLPDVLAMKPVLSETDFKTLGEAAVRGPIRKDDPGALSTLLRLMYTDAPSAARFASTAYANGKLADDTFRTESARAHSLSREQGLKSEYERSRAWIVQTLNPGELIPDPVGRQRLGDAVRTFDDWVLAAPPGKPRTDQETRERATEVLDQYRFLNLSDTVMALPMPRGVNIPRSTDKAVLAPSIATAARKLLERRNNRELSQVEYDNEMATLARWKRAMENN